MRSDALLLQRLSLIWKKYFQDVPIENRVLIGFGRKAQRRLGSIRRINLNRKKDKFDTLILLNGYFKDKLIPQFVIDATIAHELAHYAQGFSSPLPRLSRFPHRGGSVDNELKNRGLQWLVDKELSWLNQNWDKYLDKKEARP